MSAIHAWLWLFPLSFLGPALEAQQFRPVAPITKPAHYVIQPGWDTRTITVKFHDGLLVRVSDGELSDLGTGALRGTERTLERFRGGSWTRAQALAEETLDQMREAGQSNVGFALPDLNLQFRLALPEGVDAGEAIDALNALDQVEFAESLPCAAPPQAPDHRDKQGYTQSAPYGVGSGLASALPDFVGASTNLAATGANARIADIEWGYDIAHADLPFWAITQLTPQGYTNPAFDSHGTAVLGEMLARDDGRGVTGMVHRATAFFAHAVSSASAPYPYGQYVVDSSITQCAYAVGQGGIVLVEVQIGGPNYTGLGGSQYGMLPVDWHYATWLAVQFAVGMGVTVVEAAGNGNQNLDDALYVNHPSAPHNPFLLSNDSGAIVVGAGSAPDTLTDGRVRLDFSNYGARVDVQAWGEKVATCGYGDLYVGANPQEYLTQSFNGTSSASPIVAGACAQVQSLYLNQHPLPLTPAKLRDVLRNSGSPQQASATHPISENIGPRPNVMRALVALRLFHQPQFAVGFDDNYVWTPGLGLGGPIYALTTFDDDGVGPRPRALYAGGSFYSVANVAAYNVARWNGGSWSELKVGANGDVRALAAHDPDGNGPQRASLYAGGYFNWAGGVTATGIARWDGTDWFPVGGGVSGATASVHALASFDEDGSGPQPPTLFVGGDFTHANGGLVYSPNIARWRNNTWLAAGGGLDQRVVALTVFDSDHYGPGPAQLIAGGEFSWSGATQTRHLATWSSSAWFEFGGGANGTVRAFGVWPSPESPFENLFVGGDFSMVGNVSASYAAEWIGGSASFWISLANYSLALPAPNGPVHAIAVLDDGWLPDNVHVYRRVYMAGELHDPSNVWQRQVWCYAIGTGHATKFGTFDTASAVFALAGLDEDGADSLGADLYVGGEFINNGSGRSRYIAKLFGKPREFLRYCTGKINSLGCTPQIWATGIPSATLAAGFQISSSSMLNQKVGLLLYGFNGRHAGAFQGGTLCVKPPYRRSPVLNTGGALPPINDCSGGFNLDFNAFAAGALGGNPDPALRELAQQVNCQFWGRDAGFAAPNNSMLTDALEFLLGP